MNISAPFIRRPIGTSLLAAALLLAGIWAYTTLAVAPVPRVDMPTIQVSVSYPGASPETMASSVATPLERYFGRIAGIAEITSTNTLGATNVTLQFDLDRNVDGAARDVQAAIAAASSALPSNLPIRPTYRKVNPADSPILILSLTSPSLPLRDVFESANTVLAQKIAQVHGVGQVFVGGGQQPAVRVQVDPVALAGAGLSLTDVQNLIAAETVDQPKGNLAGTVRAESIAANDQLLKAEAYKKLVLETNNGQVVRLEDVATVFDDVENERVAGWTDGQRAVLVVVFRQPDANIIETSERVQKLLPTLATSISPSIKTEVAFERTATIRASVRDVELTLILSVVLVTLVVFIFLRDLRATAIPSVAVPLSIVGTFGAMYLLNYSIDNLSLMALTISTGFVVDDAIVVTENIARHIERGDPPVKAALEGAKQIGFTIVSITVSLLAVFIPILLMGGIVGRIFREFAVTLGIAVALSAVVPLSAIAKRSTSKTALSVNHQSQFPSVTISFNLARDKSLGQAMDAIDAAMRQIMVPPERVIASFSGTARAFTGLAEERTAARPLCDRHRLHRAGDALRELHPPDHDPLDAPVRERRRAIGADGVQDGILDHRAHRNHLADRHRKEECDHDGRLRDRLGARRGYVPRGGRSSRVRAALPPHHDDDDGRDPRRRPTCHRGRNGLRAADPARNHNRWRAALLADADALHDTRDLSRDGPIHEPEPAGVATSAGSRSNPARAGRGARPRVDRGVGPGYTPGTPTRHAGCGAS